MNRLAAIAAIWGTLFLSGQVLAQSGTSGADSASGATVPRLVRFSGTVRTIGDKPARGVVELSFSLFKEESGGEPLWFETQAVEVDAQGRYNVLLGAMHPNGLPMDLFTSGEARWLSIMVGKVEQPRILLVSVPYALKAGDAESLGGKPAAAYVATDQLKTQVESTLTSSKFSQQTLNATLLATGGGSTTPPAINEVIPSTFTCTSAGNCVAVTQNGSGHALAATARAGSGIAQGVRGESLSPTGRGVYGIVNQPSGVNYGVRGDSASTQGYGVFGNATSATGLSYGLFGLASSTGGVGLAGRATAVSGATLGLRGIVDSAGGTAGVFENRAGGKIISGVSTGLVEKFSVSGTGNVTAAGIFTGNGSGLANVNALLLNGFAASAFAPAVGSAAYVSKAGDTMTGTLNLPSNGLVAGTDQLVISGGNVGVGTATPAFKLDVGGRGNFVDSLSTLNTAVVYAEQTGVGVASGTFTFPDQPPAAVRGDATSSTTNVTQGVIGTSNATRGRGVTGIAWSTTGSTRGVTGFSYSESGGFGVAGFAVATTGVNVGVVGDSASPGGYGGIFSNSGGGQILSGENDTTEVFAVMNNGDLNIAGTVTAASFSGSGAGLTGVTATTAATATNALSLGGVAAANYARQDASNSFTGAQGITGSTAGELFQVFQAGTGSAVGGHAIALSGEAIGVFGVSASPDGRGVFGQVDATTGQNFGVEGHTKSTDNNAAGVYGEADATSGNTSGVQGTTQSDTSGSSGVRGMATSTTAANFGVYGRSFSTVGMGVRGNAESATGVSVGVHGESASESGIGVQGYANHVNATAGLFDNKGGGQILSGRNENTEIFSVDGSGDVTTTTGDLRALGAGKGLILKSPDGTVCARISIDNSGTLTTSAVTCP